MLMLHLCKSYHARRGRGHVAWELDRTFCPTTPILLSSSPPQRHASSFRGIMPLFKTEMDGLRQVGIKRDINKISKFVCSVNSFSNQLEIILQSLRTLLRLLGWKYLGQTNWSGKCWAEKFGWIFFCKITSSTMSITSLTMSITS